MKEKIFATWIVLLLLSCSNSDPKVEYFPDYDKIEQFKMVWVGAEKERNSNIRYRFDTNNNYTSFSSGSLFAEKYSEPDSLVIDDYFTNLTSLYITRRCIKFNEHQVVIYRYDSKMKFIQHKSIIHFNQNKIITKIQTFVNSDKDSLGFIEGHNITFSHNDQGNLIKIEEFVNENPTPVRNTNPNWRKSSFYENFEILDHSFPSLLLSKHYHYVLPQELFIMLYNKGFRFSKKGITSFNRNYVDYNGSLSPYSYSLQIEKQTEFQYEVKSFSNNSKTSKYDYFVSFKALE
jgi:hypothetical protein